MRCTNCIFRKGNICTYIDDELMINCDIKPETPEEAKEWEEMVKKRAEQNNDIPF